MLSDSHYTVKGVHLIGYLKKVVSTSKAHSPVLTTQAGVIALFI